MRRILLAITLLLPLTLWAHVNSPDVYFDGNAGPYHLLVTIRPPAVVPGVATIEIRSADKDLSGVQVVPLRMLGEASKLAPAADTAQRSQDDPQLFAGKLWIMTRGSWKVQVQAEGERGKGELSVPLPAVSRNSVTMQSALGGILAVLGLVLVIGFISMAGAATREADLEPGAEPDPQQTKRGRVREAIAAVILVAVILFGNQWWKAEAAANARLNYKVPHVEALLKSGNVLQLQITNPNEEERNRYVFRSPDRLTVDDLVPDHGHLMHLFLVSTPDMKSFWHLHPTQDGAGEFSAELPSIPAGHYLIYADIVHHTGFPETQVNEIDLPAIAAKPPAGDDSGEPVLHAGDRATQLADGYRMVWERDDAPLKAGRPVWFRFRIEDKDGKPAADLEPYMGMAGHAVFLSNDGKTFAHVHPAGSVAMAAVSLAENGDTTNSAASDMATMNHPSHQTMTPEVSFPYGFAHPGDYHIFVQIKRAGRVETGAFLAHAD
ncbi:MAG TPA: hypothetical protein VHN74_11385 [Candidatus Angelobacter sp.]|jgi:hypothetical protein|nr:hypothetical protein [Candidatus Angelobacter sp.]